MHHFLEDIWENLMIINSLFIWPASVIFLVYATGRAVITLDWKIFVIGFVVCAIVTIVQIVIGIIVD